MALFLLSPSGALQSQGMGSFGIYEAVDHDLYRVLFGLLKLDAGVEFHRHTISVPGRSHRGTQLPVAVDFPILHHRRKDLQSLAHPLGAMIWSAACCALCGSTLRAQTGQMHLPDAMHRVCAGNPRLRSLCRRSIAGYGSRLSARCYRRAQASDVVNLGFSA